ncbi:MAG TPA: tetratricopeptide repeat protein, partial [Gammaproteobacteria bacterium]|nr:tetratricopeptide repeat protein [Gammaproteobacteria bacterium]
SLLAADPGDELARAALIGLEREADPVSRESALKVLIQENPDRPYLYFNLGNVYAAQRRWAEAQQAFFDAYRLDPQNPDYANNLAVSLDRIGQYKTAVDYYLTALDLARTSAAKFNEADLLARIQQLENPGRP